MIDLAFLENLLLAWLVFWLHPGFNITVVIYGDAGILGSQQALDTWLALQNDSRLKSCGISSLGSRGRVWPINHISVLLSQWKVDNETQNKENKIACSKRNLRNYICSACYYMDALEIDLSHDMTKPAK